MNFRAILPLLLLLVSPLMLVAASSGYRDSCHVKGLVLTSKNKNEISLYANCRKKNGSYNVNTSINISRCFANNNGRLSGKWMYAYQIQSQLKSPLHY